MHPGLLGPAASADLSLEASTLTPCLVESTPNTALPGPPPGGAVAVKRAGARLFSILTRRDRRTIALMVGIPTFLCLFFIWFPTILSIVLSFTNWQGFARCREELHRPQELREPVHVYPFFWPAVWHNFLWLVVLVFIATPIGMFFAVLLDREMRGTRIYQSAFFIPVVLSLAVVGFIWELQYSPRGFINSVLGRTAEQRHRLAR